MAINYNKVGWDTTKYFNPSNMNHMDDGIKAACDKADANESAISSVSDRVTNNEKAIEQANSNLNAIGTIYEATGLTGLHAPQTYGYFGQLYLPKGSYVVVGCAKMSTKDGLCTISISANDVVQGETTLYGYREFDANRASTVNLIKLDTDKLIYFGAWAESDFEITPLYFKAIKVR